MIDATEEHPIPLSLAAREVPNRHGKRGISVPTVWRWCSRGIKGVRLETTMIGGTRMTSREAVARFFERLTAAANGSAPRQTPAKQKRAISQAEAELAKAGI